HLHLIDASTFWTAEVGLLLYTLPMKQCLAIGAFSHGLELKGKDNLKDLSTKEWCLYLLALAQFTIIPFSPASLTKSAKSCNSCTSQVCVTCTMYFSITS